MLPGKTYTAHDLIAIALRRKWWIILPFVLGSVAAVAVGKSLPFQYKSETLIMFMPQRVPVARSADDSPLEARLNTLNQQILARSRLEQIILDFDLYRDIRVTVPMEEVVRRMRTYDIQIKLETGNAVRLSYTGFDPKTAQKVTQRLAALFIEKDVSDREDVTQDTNEFLNAELEDARRRLLDHEKKLEDYRRQYSSQLPSQSASNLQTVQNAESQLQALREATNRDQERRLLLERQLDDLQSDVVVPAANADNLVPGDATARSLDAAQANLRALQLRLKPDHPDIRVAERTIRDLQAKLEAETRRDGGSASTAKPSPVTEVMRQRKTADLKAQIDNLDRQLQLKQGEEHRLRAVVAEHQSNLDAVPRRESELVELTRDYTTLQNTYAGLLNKRQEWRITTSLERRSLGDKFKILEDAREAERPVGPNRYRVFLLGSAASLAMGLLLAALLEYFDSSFRSEADIEQVLKLPVLASVPLISFSLRTALLRRDAYLTTARSLRR